MCRYGVGQPSQEAAALQKATHEALQLEALLQEQQTRQLQQQAWDQEQQQAASLQQIKVELQQELQSQQASQIEHVVRRAIHELIAAAPADATAQQQAAPPARPTPLHMSALQQDRTRADSSSPAAGTSDTLDSPAARLLVSKYMQHSGSSGSMREELPAGSKSSRADRCAWPAWQTTQSLPLLMLLLQAVRSTPGCP